MPESFFTEHLWKNTSVYIESKGLSSYQYNMIETLNIVLIYSIQFRVKFLLTLALNFCLSYSSADYVGVTFICIETCSKVKALSSVKLWSAWKILLKHLYFNDASLPLYSNLLFMNALRKN